METTLAPRASRPFPLPQDVSGDRFRSLSRAALALLIREMTGPARGSAGDIVRANWPEDRRAVEIVTRTAVPPLSTSSTGASAIMPVVGSSLFGGLQLTSAAAQLFSMCLSISLDGISTVTLPYASAVPAIPLVAEGSPIPADVGAITNAVLGPAGKMACIITATNELIEHSNAEAVIRTLLAETCGKALDALVWSTGTGGLLHGLTPITGTSGGGASALADDIKNLINSIAAGGGGRRVALVMSPGRAAAAAGAGTRFEA